MKSYQKQHEQENVWRRSQHSSVSPSTQSQSRIHGTRHSEPRRHPRSPPEHPGQPWNSHTTHTEKRPAHAEINPHQPNTRQKMGEHQKGICQTFYWLKPIPAHTNTPNTGRAATLKANPTIPKAYPEWPKGITISALYKHPQPSTPAKKTRMTGPHLLQYKNIYTMYKVNRRMNEVHGHQLMI